MKGDAELERYRREFGWTFLGEKEYAQALLHAKRGRLAQLQREDPYVPPSQADLDRWASNALISRKIAKLPDYGRLADLRELIALRLAPWLGS